MKPITQVSSSMGRVDKRGFGYQQMATMMQRQSVDGRDFLRMPVKR